MKTRFLLLLFLLTVTGFLLAPAHVDAVGLGPYVEYASGSGDFTEYDESIDIDARGFGFVFDSNATTSQLFNYRLHIGYSKLDIPGGTLDIPYRIDGYRITIDNTFGFGIIKNENFRWWIGPHLHLSYSYWDTPIGRYDWRKGNVDFFSVGTGVVTGMNFNLPKVVSICPELGLRYQYNDSDTYEERRYSSSGYYDYEEQDFSYDEWVVFLKINLLFRVGDE
ncbi:MAG: hypothetical protein R6T92_00885 [Desulfosalsimonadaceae bacterium]